MYGLTPITTAILAVFLTFSSLVRADVPHHTNLTSYQAGDLGQVPTQTFFSSSVKAPIYQVNKLDVEKIDNTGFIFLTGGYEGYGPSIISSKDLNLVYADQGHNFAQAAHTGTLYGERVLVVYAGDAVRIYNKHYELLHAVTPQGDLRGAVADSHEAHLTGDNTVALVVGRVEKADLSDIGKGEDYLTNNLIQEVEPRSNAVLFQFDLRSYFRVGDSYWPYDGTGPYHFDAVFDLWHVNSVEKTPEGDFLVSSRHLHSVFLVDGTTSKVKWVIGGKRGNFTDVSANSSAVFHWQHNAHFTAKNRISLFDNQAVFNGFCAGQERGCSRGLEIEFDTTDWTYWVVNEWYHPQSLVSASCGGVSRTPKGNTLVAWGQNPMYTEYTPDGELVMDVQRGQVLPLDHGIVPVVAYRAEKADWVGMPTWPPSIAVNADGDGMVVYVSWNGATEVEGYVLFTSDSVTKLNGVGAATAVSGRMGFETSFQLTEKRRYARVAALDRNGTILGYTMAIDTVTHKTLDPGYPADDLITLKKVDRVRMFGISVFSYAAVLLVVGFTAALAMLIIRGTRAGIRWGHCGIAEYKRRTSNFTAQLFRIIRGRNGRNDDACRDVCEEEESLMVGRGSKNRVLTS
ncbi:Arylsulfotransferase-domain-containing protein [Xylaria digitata]|nr:Arylsulfotransferase-domain-containing protein [Xylaria digitata]